MNTCPITQHADTFQRNTKRRKPSELMSVEVPSYQDRHFKGSGRRQSENRRLRFLPPFLHRRSGAVYLSRFTDGQLAPTHRLNCLPQQLVAKRKAIGRVTAPARAGGDRSRYGDFVSLQGPTTEATSGNRTRLCQVT